LLCFCGRSNYAMSSSRKFPNSQSEVGSSDDRSTLARAHQWATRIMVVSLEMVLPGLAGFWVDQRLGTLFVFLLIGIVLGCTGGFWHLIRLTSASTRKSDRILERNHKGEQSQ